MITERAYAKINLFLDVTDRRADGFHDIKTVMHTVSLSDTLTVSAVRSDKVEIILETDSKLLPNDTANLVYRAAMAYLSSFGVMAKVSIYLEKNIPIGAGLAGGSSDAAAALRAMNRIFALATEAELLKIAERLGSDVPFCLLGGTALCEGRGERITALPSPELNHLVIAIGEGRVSTPAAYAELDKLYSNFEGSSAPDKSSAFDKLLFALDNRIPITDGLYNIFETAIFLPEITEIRSILAEHGASGVLMSGSGPSVFGIFDDSDSAASAKDALAQAGFTAFIASSAK